VTPLTSRNLKGYMTPFINRGGRSQKIQRWHPRAPGAFRSSILSRGNCQGTAANRHETADDPAATLGKSAPIRHCAHCPAPRSRRHWVWDRAASARKAGELDMQRTLFVALAVVTTMWLSSPASSDYFWDGQRISQICDGETSNTGACIGFIVGVVDGMPESARPFCLPDGVVTGTLQKIFKKFLAENPQRLTERASSLVVAAMVKAYPCARAR
jgi:hypothetical protein